jgi:hypothetical protein
MDKIAAYGGILTMGVGFSTAAAATVGDPIPVVAPAVTAAGVGAAAFVRDKQAEGQPDERDKLDQEGAADERDDRDRRDRGDGRDPLDPDDQGGGDESPAIIIEERGDD